MAQEETVQKASEEDIQAMLTALRGERKTRSGEGKKFPFKVTLSKDNEDFATLWRGVEKILGCQRIDALQELIDRFLIANPEHLKMIIKNKDSLKAEVLKMAGQ